MEQENTTEKTDIDKTVPETAPPGKNRFYIMVLTVIAGFVAVTAYMDGNRLYASIMTGNTIVRHITGRIRRHLVRPIVEPGIISGIPRLACIN